MKLPCYRCNHRIDMKVKLVLDYCHWDNIAAEVFPICSVLP